MTVDDGEASVYNGDENHKVWSGSQDQLDSIGAVESPYELFAGNTSTLGRPLRARQISQPIDVPPPPVKEERKQKRDKKSSKSSGSQSLSGTLIRPKPMHPAALQRSQMHPGLGPGPGGHGGPGGPGPASVIYGPVSGPHAARQYHTISHRGFPPGPPGPPHAHAHAHAHQHHQHMMQIQAHAHAQQLAAGMPPLQIPMMLPQQYATLQPSRSTSKKKKKDKKNGAGGGNGGVPVGMPIVPPIYAYHQQQAAMAGVPPPPMAQSLIGEPRPLSMSSRKMAASMGNGLDDSGNSGAESPSPGGTGIYRRKGHLNERAFSYSIRQEHRSRSHGSLASLQFNPPDMKKEREIAQMVAGLDLNDGADRRQMAPGPATLQRKAQAGMANGGVGPTHPHAHPLPVHAHMQHAQHHPHAIYGPLGPSSSFGKPRR